MGGTTPVYGLPYPTGTDRVTDGDNAIQALAEATDAALQLEPPDTDEAPGTSFAFSAGVANHAEGCYAWRQGRFVIARFVIAVTANFAGLATIAALPAGPGWRPTAMVRLTMSKTDFTSGAQILGDGTGNLQIYVAATSGTFWYGTAVYAVPALSERIATATPREEENR